MEENIYVENNNHNISQDFLIDVPEHCPLCGENMVPLVFPNGIMSDLPITKDNFNQLFEVAFTARCTKCKHLYINLFTILLNQVNRVMQVGKVCQPVADPEININFPEIINKEYSKFKEIYIQALQAEALHLNKLVGMGLRKSLEFLIKDYAIHINPDKENEIKKASLGQVIENYYGSMPQLQSLSKMATYIGNDETHYIRKWNDQDIKSMKKFIMSAVNLISGTLYAEKAAKLIDENKK